MSKFSPGLPPKAIVQGKENRTNCNVAADGLFFEWSVCGGLRPFPGCSVCGGLRPFPGYSVCGGLRPSILMLSMDLCWTPEHYIV